MGKVLKITNLVVALLAMINCSIAQNSALKIYSSFSFQDTDKRIFGVPNMVKNRLLEGNEKKKTPSVFFDLGLSYEALSFKKISMDLGFRYGFEWNNSNRNYDHCAIQGDPCNFVLLYVDGYSYHTVGPMIDVFFEEKISKNLGLRAGVNLSSNFRFFSYYDSRFKYFWNFDYLFTEISPKLGIVYKHIEIGLYGRLWQHRKVDRIIYPERNGGGFPVLSENYMNINPLKIGLYFKHDLPFRKGFITVSENMEN